MSIVRDAIRLPVTTAVGVLLLALFGFIALFRIPIQLTPTVEEPEVTVTTVWFGASPLEIEREIVQEQEEQLKSIEGLVRMESSSQDNQGTITLTFQVGTDLDTAVLKVSNRLEQVPSYPNDADKPVIRTVDASSNAIAWFVLQPTGENRFEGDIATLYDFLDDYVKPELERVPGAASSAIYGGREREMNVIVDPAKLAARRVTFGELASALDRENRNYSGGDFDEGKRRYIVRTVGEYSSPEEIENVVIAIRNGTAIYVRDVGYAEMGHRKPQAKVFHFGEPSIAMNVVKETGANSLEVMAGIKERVARLNEDLLAPRGLHLVQAYDETDYILSAISLVEQNLVVGGSLAVIVLLLFLRSFTSTLIIAVAIPISVIGTFLMMNLFGRTLNVVSLAGMAFAVGMVVDNSIVVLENIYRHRQMGKTRFQAALDGANEVWGAVLASTLTTIAVFVPVVFVQQEAGQLFRDIAIAISCAVGLSLVVSMTVIPSLSAKILRAAEADHSRFGFHNLFGGVYLAEAFTNGVTRFVYWLCGGVLRRVVTVLSLTGIAIGMSLWLMPKTEYLPQGNRNLLFGIMLPPPGYNVDEVAGFLDIYTDNLSHLWTTPAEEAVSLPGGGVDQFFFVATPNQSFMGVRARDELRVRELLPEFQQVNTKFPGTIAFIQQSSIFATGIGEGRNIDIEITGPELTRLVELGGEVFGRVLQTMPTAQARPIPSLDLGNPEVRVLTDRYRAAEAGITNRDLGFAVSALVDGAKASDYQDGGKQIDLRVRAQESFAHRTHLLEQLPISTPDGRLITLGSVAEVSVVNGPAQIDRRERQRSIVIQVTPPEQMPLEAAMDTIQAEILGPMIEAGRLGGAYRTQLTGTADKLSQTANALQWNFLLALTITYLLMAALFESFLHPLVIMFSVPLAALGGFLGLAALNAFVTFQALDILTMLGFIILVGTVVNNAILIVHQALNYMREENIAPREAIRESTRTRIRPIFMSVATSVSGMMPLVLFPGAGSELYRGLGSVVVGGLVVSTVFTLFLVPALFSLVLDAQNALARGLRSLMGKEGAPATGD
jgi:hydrophobic/amphiphilic exporter-1 (mainly G- bacteria), HAE1 family